MPKFPDLFAKKRDELVLGRTGRFGFFPKFKISYNVRKFHTYVVGLTGRGKSKLLQSCLVQDISAGRGCCVIDPHGDLAKDTLRTLISNCALENNTQLLERIVYVAPRRRDYIIPFNVLKKEGSELETYEIAQRVIAAFQRTWPKTLGEAPRFQQIMRASLAVLIENGLPLTSLYQVLVDDSFRNQLLDNIPDKKVETDCRLFFENEYEHWGRDKAVMIGSTTNKISALTDNPSVFNMLNQKENHLDIRRIMDSGQVLILDLGDCDQETKKIFGTLIVTGFEQAALSRARASQETRTPYYLYIDEFQDFACHPGNAETFSQMLSQVRKFGLHMILANQSIAQLTPRLQTALSNAQTIISFRVSRADAEALARILGWVNTTAIKRENQTDTQHPVYASLPEQWEHIIQQLTGQEVRQVTVKTADDRRRIIWPEKISTGDCQEEQLEELILKSLIQYGKPIEDRGEMRLRSTFPSTEIKLFSN